MSPAAGPTPRSHLSGWLPLIIAAVVFTITICVVVAVRADSTSDFRDYWRTAGHFRETGEVTTDLGVHNYLPFFTIFMTPWSLLPLRVAIVLFSLLSLGLLGLTVVMVELLLNGQLDPRPHPATLITLGLIAAYVVSSSVLGTVNVLVLFLVIAAWFLIERGRDWQAGIPLGLAALIKVLPVALILFFLLKRRWRVAGAGVATVLILGLGLPLLALGPAQAAEQHRAFFKGAIRGHSAYQTITAEQPRKAKYNNNSLPIVLRHLLTRIDAHAGEPEDALYVNFAELPPRMIWWLYLALMLALLVPTLHVTLRGPPKWPPDDIDGVRSLRAQFGVWTCLMVLASPLLWTHYFVWAYWPLAVAADRAERTRRARGKAIGWSAAALLVWLAGALLLAWPPARAAGAQLAALAFLWLALTIQAYRPAR